MLKRPIADAKIAALVEGRNLYEGRAGAASSMRGCTGNRPG
jgi:hypothetical protein